ncbi:FecR family protein [Sphingobacterium sp. HMA12]|uniref:FecR family protein n=1 Tax=Sphingobacterium sp. HMA12 TaxID=2050894 RepID=UPI000CEA02B3|nr:FecR family protein [Sphingobacterium sp. HMA12]
MRLTEDIKQLIVKCMHGDLSAVEKDALTSWLAESPAHRIYLDDLLQKEELMVDLKQWILIQESDATDWNERLKTKTLATIHAQERTIRIHRVRRIMAYAAALCCFVLAGLIYQFVWKPSAPNASRVVLHDIELPNNHAEIRLSNGKVIQLDNGKGVLVTSDGLKYADGSLIQSTVPNVDLIATINTPAGSMLQITLADGSQVTLNAKTSFKYPLQFTQYQRLVEVDGEAYFKVAKNKKVPFRVKSNGQLIEVTGTEFNVNTYSKQKSSTTLVEGSINLLANGQQMQLKPNQQATLSEGRLSQKSVDPHNYTAWIDNKFYFNETDLHTALQAIGQWYDLQIIYKNTIKETYLYGEIQRTKSLSAVLEILKRSNIQFELIQENDTNKLLIFN